MQTYCIYCPNSLDFGVWSWRVGPIPSKRHRKPRTDVFNAGLSGSSQENTDQETQAARTNMRQRLNLPTLASRRQVLKLSSFFKVVEGLVPGLPIDNFLVKARPKRNIKIKQYKDHQTQNILERQVVTPRQRVYKSTIVTQSNSHTHLFL